MFMKIGAMTVSVLTGVLGSIFVFAGAMTDNLLTLSLGGCFMVLGVRLSMVNLHQLKKKKGVNKNFEGEVSFFAEESEKRKVESEELKRG